MSNLMLRSMPAKGRLFRRRWAVVAVLPVIVACASDHLSSPGPAERSQLYWDLRLNHHAVTLSTTPPYDTLTLIATPRNDRGEPLAGLPAPQYRVVRGTHVVVSPDGVLHAVEAADDSDRVVATVTIDNLTHSDTVDVKVVDDPTPPVLAGLSVIGGPDSAKIGSFAASQASLSLFFSHQDFSIQATDAGGTPIPGILVGTSVSDATVLGIDFPSDITGFRLLGRRPGTASLYVSATAFGVTKADTITYRVGWPVAVVVGIAKGLGGMPGNVFAAPEVTIGTGGIVIWDAGPLNVASPLPDSSTTIVFDDSTAVAPADYSASNLMDPLYYFLFCGALVDCTSGGNFTVPAGSIGMRAFSVPGTYEYHNSDNGARGRVVVVDER